MTSSRVRKVCGVSRTDGVHRAPQSAAERERSPRRDLDVDTLEQEHE